MDTNVNKVISHTVCNKHGAHYHGQPCWWIHTSAGVPRGAVCNARIKKYGFTGEISDRAMRRTPLAA